MITTSELNKDQVADLDMTISITLKVRQWKHIAEELNITQASPGWTGTKADFIYAIRDSIVAMTNKTEQKFDLKS